MGLQGFTGVCVFSGCLVQGFWDHTKRLDSPVLKWSLRVWGFRVLGFRVLEFRVLGLRVWGFRALGFRVLEFRVLGLRVYLNQNHFVT